MLEATRRISCLNPPQRQCPSAILVTEPPRPLIFESVKIHNNFLVASPLNQEKVMLHSSISKGPAKVL